VRIIILVPAQSEFCQPQLRRRPPLGCRRFQHLQAQFNVLDGSDCSFTSKAQCEATASGQRAECFRNYYGKEGETLRW
jgi:hypothetical protein